MLLISLIAGKLHKVEKNMKQEIVIANFRRKVKFLRKIMVIMLKIIKIENKE